MTPLQTSPTSRDRFGGAGTRRGMRRPAVATALAFAVVAAGGCAPAELRLLGSEAGVAAEGAVAAQWRAPQGSAGRSSTASAAASVAGRAKRPPIPRGVTPGYMVYDTQARKVTAHYRAHAKYRSASIVKILIALDYLESRPKGSAIPKQDLALLRPMLRSSHDDAATVFWRRGGQTAIIQRMKRRLKLTDSGPPPAGKPGFWGYTAISAADIVKVYRYLLERAQPAHRDFILGNLRKATKCGADGFDQSFGIPRAVPKPWAVKQGWSGYGTVPPVKCAEVRANSLSASPVTRPVGHASTSGAAAPGVDFSRPVLHTTGLAGKDDRFIIVLLTSQPAGVGYQSGMNRITKLAKGVYRAGGGR